MSNVAKLKEKARTLEPKHPAQAIETYLQILEELEGTPELDAELALFNKVGDLYQDVHDRVKALANAGK